MKKDLDGKSYADEIKRREIEKAIKKADKGFFISEDFVDNWVNSWGKKEGRKDERKFQSDD